MQRLKKLRMKTEKRVNEESEEDVSVLRKNIFPNIALTNRRSKGVSGFSKKSSGLTVGSQIRKSAHSPIFFQNRYSCSRQKSEQQKGFIRKWDKSVQPDRKVKIKFQTSLFTNKGKNGIGEYASNSFVGKRAHNEDRITLQLNFEYGGKIFSYFGIFDGHGGSLTAEFLYSHLFKLFQSQIKNGSIVSIALQKALAEAESKLLSFFSTKKTEKSGSCALIAVIEGENLYIANIGDSRAILIEGNQKITQLTQDHKPELERVRLQSHGCKIYRMISENEKPIGPYRVWPSKLSVSRTIGDFFIKQLQFGSAISSLPDIFEYRVQKGSKLLLFSDGAYEGLSNQQIGNLFIKSSSLNEGIDTLLLKSVSKGTIDNISIIAVELVQ